MTLFPVTMTPNRLGVVEFTSPFLNEVLLIGIARSTFREESLYLWLFRSFKTSVWITVIVVVAVISCVRMVTKWKHPSDSNDEGWLVIFYLMLQQGVKI